MNSSNDDFNEAKNEASMGLPPARSARTLLFMAVVIQFMDAVWALGLSQLSAGLAVAAGVVLLLRMRAMTSGES
jgi:hypothetical protein